MAGKDKLIKKAMEQKFKYTFANPGLWKGLTAAAAATELERIRQKHGTLKPEAVVEESEPEGAVLHGCFQWDDTIAARLWRNEQAKALIRNIMVEVSDKTVTCTVRALVNVASEPTAQRSYVPITEAIHNETSYADLLKQAKQEMVSFVKKYNQISELNRVKAEMLKVINL